jgi:hypothetical protein
MTVGHSSDIQPTTRELHRHFHRVLLSRLAAVAIADMTNLKGLAV